MTHHDETVDAVDPLMSIGAFSRASSVSVKALRSYHESGLLVPDSIDPSTGYRRYRVSQLTDATVIRRLRDLDLPLREVAEIVAARDPEITRKVIADHQATMERRLEEVTAIVQELQAVVDRPERQTPVHTRTEAETHAFAVYGTVDSDDYGPFLDDAFRRLFAAVGATGAALNGASAARYPATYGDTDQAVEAYLPVVRPVGATAALAEHGVSLAIVPAATCAVITHVGDYDGISDTYRQLGAWVAHNASSADEPVREHYVVSIDPHSGALLPADQLRTEIAWPLADPEKGITR